MSCAINASKQPVRRFTLDDVCVFNRQLINLVTVDLVICVVNP